MEYAEVLDWLYAQLPMFQRTGPVRYRIDLEKTHALCAALGHPERGLNVVHIAGTNGKGSVSHAVSAALQARGHTVGLYTSPHLEDPRERIRINGEWISREAFVAFVVDHMAVWEELQPSFFELMFTMALSAFQSAGVDRVVLETGMGGRLDSTNIFPAPLVTAITSIGLDHQQFLGPDLRSIAGEKAGILKEGVPCVLGILPPEARSVVLERSMRLGVEVHDGLTDPAETAGPEWLARNRAVARRILHLLPGDAAVDEEALRARAELPLNSYGAAAPTTPRTRRGARRRGWWCRRRSRGARRRTSCGRRAGGRGRRRWCGWGGGCRARTAAPARLGTRRSRSWTRGAGW